MFSDDDDDDDGDDDDGGGGVDDDDECRVPFASYEFLAMTAQTITDTITELAEAECEASDR